jgi:O-antigen ligase/polysaccharide polymerase Wzy-like membrane protein
MIPSSASTSRLHGNPRAWGQRLIGGALLVATGVLLGEQYLTPNKRVIPSILALIVFGMAWRFSMMSGIGVLVMALPFPRGTTFGNTNLALILMLAVIWLLRISQRESALPRRTPLDAPMAALLLCYVLSFYNVSEMTNLKYGLANFELFVGCLLTFVLIVNSVRTRRDLELLHLFQIASAVSLFVLAVYELNHPGAMFIRGWLDFTQTTGTEFNTKNVRVGSSFRDYELLSEFCVITLGLVVFRLVRARSFGARAAYIGVMLLNVFVLFTTVTRGAIIAGGIGMVLLLWMIRRRLRVVPFTIVTGGATAGLLALEWYVSHYTRSGDIFTRLMATQVVNGWMPDSRADVWPNAWARALVHPLLGQGPYYGVMKGYALFWPHCVYLYYANILGFTGLAVFLWLLWKLWKATRPTVDQMTDPDYAEAFKLVARTQLVVFAVNEVKIDYLRNPIYQFVVWVMFASWVAAELVTRHEALPAPAAEPVRAPARRPIQPAVGRA